MRVFLSLTLIMLVAVSTAQQRFVYVRDNTVISPARDLPSLGIRQDNGRTVLGLHGSDDATRAACGWYRIVPSVQRSGSNEVVVSRSYVIGKNTVQEVLQFAERRTVTVEQRIAAILKAPELQSMQEDARIAVIIGAVAQAITGAVDRAIVVTIPAKEAPPEDPLPPVKGGMEANK